MTVKKILLCAFAVLAAFLLAGDLGSWMIPGIIIKIVAGIYLGIFVCANITRKKNRRNEKEI